MKHIFIILFTTFSLLVNAQISKKDENFEDFIIRLKKISKEKDLEKLKSILHDSIFESNDICGYPGCSKSEFFKHYFVEGQLDKDWKKLSEIIYLGFIKIPLDSAIVKYNLMEEVYEAPSYMRKIDNNKSLIILDENVSIKEKPTNNSKTINVALKGKTYSCNCCIYSQTDIDVVEDELSQNWIRIKLNNKNYGYVLLEKTSQKFYKILEIALIKGKWKIIAWYTGESC